MVGISIISTSFHQQLASDEHCKIFPCSKFSVVAHICKVKVCLTGAEMRSVYQNSCVGCLRLSSPINPTNWVMHTQQQLVVNLYDCALPLFNGFDKHAHLHRSAFPARHCAVVLQYQSHLCVEVRSHRRVSLRETPDGCLIKSFIRPDHAVCAGSIMAPCWMHRAALLMQISPFAFSLSEIILEK